MTSLDDLDRELPYALAVQLAALDELRKLTPKQSKFVKERTATMPAPQRYRLLKDIPMWDAGTIFRKGSNGKWESEDNPGMTHPYLDAMLNASQPFGLYFAPIAPDGQQGGRSYTVYTDDYESFGNHIDKIEVQLVNHTREQAELTAEAIRAVLDFIHTDSKDPTFNYEPMLQARKAVQNTNDKETA